MTPPPVIRPSPPPDPRIGMWITGAIFTVLGVFMALFDNPYVPLSYAFHLVPLALGAAVGAAVLWERHKIAGIAFTVLATLWLLWQIAANQTSAAPIYLFGGVLNLARAGLRTFRDE